MYWGQEQQLLLTKMNEQTPKLLPEQIFQTGCVWDAFSDFSFHIAKNRR